MTLFDSTTHTRLGNLRTTESISDGPVVVLLHRSSFSRKVFRPQLESPLAKRYRMISVDLPGHGESQDAYSDTDYLLPSMAGAVADLLAAKDVDRAVICGWALGGYVGLELSTQTELVAGVMLCGAPPVPPGLIGLLRGFRVDWDLWRTTRRFYSLQGARKTHRKFFPDLDDEPFIDDVQRADGRARGGGVDSVWHRHGVNLLEAVARATVPIAIVNGANDHIVRLSYLSKVTCPTLWQNRCHVVPGAAHAPFWEQPGLFNRLLGQFANDCTTIGTPEPA